MLSCVIEKEKRKEDDDIFYDVVRNVVFIWLFVF